MMRAVRHGMAAGLLLAGGAWAAEPDPRLKDPAIDHATADLSAIPPLQLTFVPEARKKENLTRVHGEGFELVETTDPAFCRQFLKDWNAWRGIEIQEPIFRTNLPEEANAHPTVRKYCPAKDPTRFFDETTRTNRQRMFGFRIYDVSTPERPHEYVLETGPSWEVGTASLEGILQEAEFNRTGLYYQYGASGCSLDALKITTAPFEVQKKGDKCEARLRDCADSSIIKYLGNNFAIETATAIEMDVILLNRAGNDQHARTCNFQRVLK